MPRKGDIRLSSRFAQYASSDSDADNEDKEEEVLPVISDSSDEEDEKKLRFYQKQLQNLRRQGLVKGIGDSDSEQESDEEDEEDEEAGLPSRFAWGNKKSVYFGGDVRDGNIGLGHEDRMGMAALEEKEVLVLQTRRWGRYGGDGVRDLKSSDNDKKNEKKTKKEMEKKMEKGNKKEKEKKKKGRKEEEEKKEEKMKEKKKGKSDTLKEVGKVTKKMTEDAEYESSDDDKKKEKNKRTKEKEKEKKGNKKKERKEEEEKKEETTKEKKKKKAKSDTFKEDGKVTKEVPVDPDYEKFKKKHLMAEPLYEEMFEVDRLTCRLSKVYEAVRDGDSRVVWDVALRYLSRKFKLGLWIVMYTLLYVNMALDNFPTQHHPILEDLLCLRHSWKSMEPLDKIFEESVEKSLEQLENGETVTFGLDVLRKKRKRKAKVQTPDEEEAQASSKQKTKRTKTDKEELPPWEQDGLQDRKRKAKLQTPDEEEAQASSKQKTKRAKTDKEELPPWEQDKLQDSDEETSEEEEAKHEEEEDEEGGRGATKEMEKNEGLKAYKKRKQKHARTKHREKYRKALIRRKGQVRVYKPEIEKYRGEASGIRAGVIRSRRIRV